ncbi:MAG: serine hydrolase [Melioribacteraceae bacterium]|nr:serine hydrolase [Melioribacteraceae bacterium]
MKSIKNILLILAMLFFTSGDLKPYPIDGYTLTGIKRLLRLQLILEGKIIDQKPISGALKLLKDIKLNLACPRGDSLAVIPSANPEFQNSINKLFPNLDESYAISVLEITSGKKIRYAQRQQNRGFMPGSIGKLAILAGLFSELEQLYPDSFEDRQQLLKNTFVKAGKWAITNIHSVPFFNPENNQFFKRTVQNEDVFSLYEWVDHMISVSSNAAASIVWREAVLIRAFKNRYPVSEETAKDYFNKTSKSELTKIAISVVNDPLRTMKITEDEWRLGSLFTSEAKKIIPGSGGSIATPGGLMKYLIAMERGKIVDEKTSLEIKRFLYMTDKRIRYASTSALTNAAVYFKSGSFYKCKNEEGFVCEKYCGNVENFMNSVVIVEHPDGTTYFVTLMSNVLRKNSNTDHMYLASQIDKIIRKN